MQKDQIIDHIFQAFKERIAWMGVSTAEIKRLACEAGDIVQGGDCPALFATTAKPYRFKIRSIPFAIAVQADAKCLQASADEGWTWVTVIGAYSNPPSCLVEFATDVYRDAVARLRKSGEELVFLAAGNYEAGLLTPVEIPDSLADWSGAWLAKSEADAAIRRALKVCNANTVVVCRDAWVSHMVGVRPRDASDRQEGFMLIAEIAGVGIWRGIETFSRIGQTVVIADAMPPLLPLDNGETWFQP